MNNDQVLKITNLPRVKAGALVIRWQVTSLCNYDCDFCIQGGRKGHAEMAKGESADCRRRIANALVSFLETKLPQKRVVDLYLIGGEVTILKDFRQILESIVRCRFKGLIRMHLTTNLSMSEAYCQELCSLFRFRRNRQFNLSASFYSRYTSIEDFMDKLVRIRKKSKWLFFSNNIDLSAGIPILCDSDWLRTKELRAKYFKTGVNVTPIRIRNYDVALSDKTQAELNQTYEHRRKLQVTFSDGSERYFENVQQLGAFLEDTGGSFNPNGYLCDAGKLSFSISSDGSIWRCPVLGAPASFRIGDIEDIGSALLDAPAVCHAGHSSCNYFSVIEKQAQ